MIPKPVVVGRICSCCGLEWERHLDAPKAKTKPTLERCVELLRADLAEARKPVRMPQLGGSVTQSIPVSSLPATPSVISYAQGGAFQ